MTASIEKSITKHIRPYLTGHGGDIEIVGYEKGVLTVKFTGHCANCMASQDTFEQMVKDTIYSLHPEVKEIILDQSVHEDLLQFARKLLQKDAQ